MKKRGKSNGIIKKILASTLIATMLLGLFSVADMRYGMFDKAYAMELSKIAHDGSTVDAPDWSISNFPDRDTTGQVYYYYAGNAFHALNQINDPVTQNGLGGTYNNGGVMKLYYVQTTTSGGKTGIKGYWSSGSQTSSQNTEFYQRDDIDFSKTWELMDTDATWDDEYLYSTYTSGSGYLSDFVPKILTEVNSWYTDKGWFSDAEKSAVHLATVKTDGTSDATSTQSPDSLDNAGLFAPSADEMYKNPVQISEVYSRMVADSNSSLMDNSTKYARSYLWSRSFWGCYPDSSGTVRCGFFVLPSYGLSCNNVSYLFGAAPAFYLDLDKVVMARSANAGSEATAQTTLQAYDASALGNSVKFLIQDANFAPSFTSSIDGMTTNNVVAGQTYTVDYDNAQTTTVGDAGNQNNSALFISAMLYDENGKICYYSPIEEVTEASGEAEITIPSDIDASKTYKLAVFEEQLGGTSVYKTENNTAHNGSASGFSQNDYSNHGTYTSYESDYMSGGVAYMSLQAATAQFDVDIPASSFFYSGRTYSGSEIDELVTATLGASAISNTTSGTNGYYVIAKDDFEDLGKVTDYDTITNAKATNNVYVPYDAGTANTTRDLLFFYYSSTSAAPQIAERTITVSPDREENSVAFDSVTWYDATENGILWHYKLDKNGDIIGLYTEDSDLSGIINGGTLNIPARVGGRTVVGIGDGTESDPHPVIPSNNTSWSTISFPASITTLNDFAFYGTTANASVVIPNTVKKIGTRAFKDSSISSLIINKMSGTIGSLAFDNCASLNNLTIYGGDSGIEISQSTFSNSKIQKLSLAGNVTINKSAFKGNTSLNDLVISEGSTITIGEYAFEGCTGLTTVYVPAGVTLKPYAFNNCSNITKVESGADLVNHVFENCNKIQHVILDSDVETVEYDWNGHSGEYSTRNIYVYNPETRFTFYEAGEFLSPFASGSANINGVKVYAEEGNDIGFHYVRQGDTEYYSNVYTLQKYYTDYSDYINGSATNYNKAGSKYVVAINGQVASTAQQMNSDGIDQLSGIQVNQTGINAYYTGVILTGKELDKSNMTVNPMYNTTMGDALDSDMFYVVRTSDYHYNSDLDAEEAEVKALKVVASEDDLDTNSDIGTIAVTVIEYLHNNSGVAIRRFSKNISIRVEEYSDEKDVLYQYEKLSQIVAQIKALQDEVDIYQSTLDNLKDDLAATTANAELDKQIDDLTKKNAELQAQYDALSDKSSAEALSLKNQIEANEATIAELEAQKTANMDAAVQNLENRISGLESDKNQLASEKAALESEYNALSDKTSAEAKAKKAEIEAKEEQISSLEDQISRLSSLKSDLSSLVTSKDQVIEDYKNEISDLITELDEYKAANNAANMGYVDNTDPDGDGTGKVYINGDPFEYDMSSGKELEITSDNGIVHKYTQYKGHGDIDGDGTEEDFWFYVGLDGLHVTRVDSDYTNEMTDIDSLSEAIRKAQQELGDLNDQIDNMKEAMDATAKELQDAGVTVNTDPNASEEDNMAAIKDAVKDLIEKYSGVKDDYSDLKEAIYGDSSVDVDSKTLDETLEALKAITGDTKDVQAAIEKALTGNDVSPDEAKALGALLDQISTMRATLESDTATMTDIKKALNVTNDEEVLNTIADLHKQLEALNTKNAKLEAENTTLAAQNAKLIEEKGSETANSDTVDTTSASYKAGYTAGYTQGSTDNNSVTDETLKAQVATLTTKVSTLTSENESLTSKNKSLKSDNDDLEEKVSKLKKNSSSDSSSGLSSENSSLRAQNSSLMAENSTLKAQNNTLNGTNSTLTSENSNLKSQNNSLSSENSKLKDQVSTLQKQSTAKNDASSTEKEDEKKTGNNAASDNAQITPGTISANRSGILQASQKQSPQTFIPSSSSSSVKEPQDTSNTGSASANKPTLPSVSDNVAEGEKKGLSGGALAGIIAGIALLGGAGTGLFILNKKGGFGGSKEVYDDDFDESEEDGDESSESSEEEDGITMDPDE